MNAASTPRSGSPIPDYTRKLIEVGLPLKGLNDQCIREKKISKGHPSTLHYWWAPRPLAAIRAVIFATLVNDPSSEPSRFPTLEDQDKERDRLFDLIVRMADWDNRTDPDLWRKIQTAVEDSNPGGIPPILDPFCGRGTIPFEAQRMNLQGISSDLNPIPATIARALGTIPALARGQQAINPVAAKPIGGWKGVDGLVSDLEYYASKVEEHARRAVGSLFGDVTIDSEAVGLAPDLSVYMGRRFTPLGWLWAKTATCSNPACGHDIPLLGQMWLCKRAANKSRPAVNLWIEPRVGGDGTLRLAFVSGSSGPEFSFKGARAGFFRCACCGESTTRKAIETQAVEKGLGKMLIGAVVDGPDAKLYVPATEAMRQDVKPASAPAWRCELPVPDYSQALPGPIHGVRVWGDFFTDRQTIMLEAFAAGIRQAVSEAAGHDTGQAEVARVESLAVLLALCVGKLVNRSNAFCFWNTGRECVEQPFLQQGIQKSWDFFEANPFSGRSGSWTSGHEYPRAVIENSPQSGPPVEVYCRDVRQTAAACGQVVVVTDPPYYANMGYADLSDMFYIWIRRTLEQAGYQASFGTLLTPKDDELAANAHRFGGDKSAAERFFVSGFEDAFSALMRAQDPRFPMTFFYAYKQQEKVGSDGIASTGWVTLLEGLVSAGWMVTATWPVRTEDVSAIKRGKSSLSTSIVLACRPRNKTAPTCSRAEFIRQMRVALRDAVAGMQRASIRPVDLRQGGLGPGMAVFSRYKQVVESDGSPMSVREALKLINAELDEILTEQDADYDSITRFAAVWFEQHGFAAGDYGTAQILATAQNISVESVVEAGLLEAKAGKVRLLRIDELDSDWEPETDNTPTVWEMTHHLCRRYDDGGERAAADLIRRLGHHAEAAQQLAFRLFLVCDTRKWSEDAQPYNRLGTAWNDLMRLALDPTAASRGLSRAEESAESEEESLYADD